MLTRTMNKKIIYSALFLLPLIGFGLRYQLNKKQITTKSPQKVISKNNLEDSVFSLVAVGDIMMGTNYPSADGLPPKSTNLLDSVLQYLKEGDLTFGNLEGSMFDGEGTPKKCSNPAVCYAFRQPTYFMKQLQAAGFDLFSIANNHLGDFGDIGRAATCATLKEYKMKYAGLERCPWDTLTVKGVKIGFTAFAPNTQCLQITDYTTLTKTVKLLSATCDIVIVSFHGGAEGSSKSHVPKMEEIFLGENRGDVYKFARVAIDAGADVVLGHGPHVTRAVDIYKNRFIAYSMGNFCTYGSFNLKGISGLAPIYQLKLKKDGSFISGKVIPTMQKGEGGPLFDPNKSVFQEIRNLTKSDFPENGFQLSENGFFTFN